MFRIITALLLILGVSHQVQCTQPAAAATRSALPNITIIENNLKSLWRRFDTIDPYMRAFRERKFGIALVNYILSCPEELPQYELYTGFQALLETTLDTTEEHRAFKITLDGEYNISAVELQLDQVSPISFQQVIDGKMQELVYMEFPILDSLGELVTLNQFKHNLYPNINGNISRYHSYLHLILTQALPRLIGTNTRNFELENVARDITKDARIWQFLVTKDIAKEFEGLNGYQICCYFSKLLNIICMTNGINCETAEVYHQFQTYVQENHITYKTVCAEAKKFDAVNKEVLKKLRARYFPGRHVQTQLMELISATLEARNAAVRDQQNVLRELHYLLLDVQSDLECKAFFYILACEDPTKKPLVAVSKAMNEKTKMLFLPNELTSLRKFLEEAVQPPKPGEQRNKIPINEKTTFAEFKTLYDAKMRDALSELGRV